VSRPRSPALLRPADPARAALEASELISARLDDLERRLERLRALYESFFAGIERRPPQVPRTELNRLMLEMQQSHIRNVALRFRFQTLSQRWVLLVTYWNRTLREIETGCYRRDLERAYRRLAARGAPLTTAEATHLGIPANRVASFVERQNRARHDGAGAPAAAAPSSTAPVPAPAHADASVPPAAPEGEPALGPAAGLTATAAATPAPVADAIDHDRLHAAYARAHTELGRPGPPPSAERLRARVSAQLDRLRASGTTGAVHLAVVVRDGKVVVEARVPGDGHSRK
jgi:hypothetical protein